MWHLLWNRFKQILRVLNGDDAYARYLAHWRILHAEEPLPSRAEFFRRETERRWNGIRRCC